MSQYAPASAYRFFVEAHRVSNKLLHAKILDENQTPILNTYPNIAKMKTEFAAEEAVAFSDTHPEELEITIKDLLPNAQGAEKEVIAKAKAIVKYTSSLRQKIFNTIFTPGSSEFPPLKDAVENYWKEEDSEMKTVAIEKLGLNTNHAISHAYRTARVLSDVKDDNSSFYERLSGSIRELAEEVSMLQLLTKDDLVSLLDTSIGLDDSIIPTPEELNIQTIAISQKPLRPDYPIDPQNVDWKNLIPPTSAQIKFLGAPNKFYLSLHYQNEDGEVLDLPVWFDTKKAQFGWSFMESPNDPDMKDMRNAALLAAQSILSDVQKQADAEYQQKQREREPRTQPQRPAQGRKIRSDQPYVPRQKEKRQERLRALSPFQEVLEAQFALPVRETVKKYIYLPEEEDIRSMMAGVSQENQDRIIEGINRFNERGAGKFKALEVIQYEGKPVWELRVGDFRALVTETATISEPVNDKNQKFEIYKIGHRKEIFKKRA